MGFKAESYSHCNNALAPNSAITVGKLILIFPNLAKVVVWWFRHLLDRDDLASQLVHKSPDSYQLMSAYSSQCYLFWIERLINQMHGNTWILGLGYIFENCHFRWLKLQTSYCKAYWAHLRPPSLLDSWKRHNPSWKNKFVVLNPAFPLLQLQPNQFPQIPNRIFWCFILPTSKFQKAGWVCLKLGYPGIPDSNRFTM